MKKASASMTAEPPVFFPPDRAPRTSDGYTIHLEPGESRPFRIFLEKDGDRLPSASFQIPPRLRQLVQIQRSSLMLEDDLIECLSQMEEKDLYIHTNQGVYAVRWDPGMHLRVKTQLQLAGQQVRVQKVFVDRQQNDRIVDEFVLIGGVLIADLREGLLSRAADRSGWYVADLLAEPPDEESPEQEFEVEYEAEYEYREKEINIDAPTQAEAQKAAGFAVNEASEIPRAVFNERRIVYPQAMRDGYSRDLIFKKGEENVRPSDGRLDFGLMISRQEETASARVEATCLWEQKPFRLGDAIYKYFEYLGQHRCRDLRKKRARQQIAELAFALLKMPEVETADTWINEMISGLKLDEQAEWEAAEYLRRFYKTMVKNPSEQLLAGKDGWYLVTLDMRRFGLLFFEAFWILGGDLLLWLKNEGQELETARLFEHFKALTDGLNAHGMKLYFNRQSIQSARFDIKIDAQQDGGMQWFDIHPDIRWGGRPVSEEEWMKIVRMRGVIEEEGRLIVLEDDSLKALQTLRDLFAQVRTRKGADAQKRKIPRLHILDWMQLRKYGAEIGLSAENETLVRRLLNFDQIEERVQPDSFRGSLRDYQKDGYQWLAFLYEHRLGGCLADDMGLGKTIQAIGFLAGLNEGRIKALPKTGSLPHLIVVPPTLVFNWKSEFAQFYPGARVHEFASNVRYPDPGPGEILLTTYDMVRTRQKLFESKRFHVVIFDEAQYLKNIQAKRTTAARMLKGVFALTLTGTPLENHLGEYFSILDLSLPGLLGDHNAFRRQVETSGIERIRRRAHPFVLRRQKKHILKELPPKAEAEVLLEMTPRQKALYRKVVSKTRKTVAEAFKKKSVQQAGFTALTAMMRLRQICVSPVLFDVRMTEVSPKIQYVAQKLKALTEEEHSALVFSQFTSVLDVVEAELKKQGLDYFRMDGKVTRARRQALVDSFQCGAGAPIFLISLKTGGVGLNLTRASYVFHLDPWWNPAVENQASDRVHRIGQQKRVFVTKLLMRNSIEEKMLILQNQKRALYESVLDHSLKSVRFGSLSREDFDFLLK